MGYKKKTKKAIAKRFKLTATGKVKRPHGGKSHLLTNKSRNRKRHLGKGVMVAKQFEKQIREGFAK